MDELYRAIADPTRRAILDELVERNGQTLFELCGRLIMNRGIESSRQAISQHLQLLEQAGLVTTQRQGRCKFHWFNGEPLRAISRRWPIGRKRRQSEVGNDGAPRQGVLRGTTSKPARPAGGRRKRVNSQQPSTKKRPDAP